MKKRGIEQNQAIAQVALQNSNNNEVTVIVNPKEMIKKLMEQGKWSEAIAELKEIHDMIGQSHPHPYYKYKTVIVGNRMVLQHEPLDNEIAKRYPLSFKGKATIDKTEFEEGESFEDLLIRKRLAQDTIKVDMRFLETWIGEQKIEDDFTLEQEAAKDGEWVIVPEKLPPPLRVKLVLHGEQKHTIVEYLELRLTKKSKKENLIIISNSHQENCPYLLSLSINLRDEQQQKQTFKGKVSFLVREGFEGLVKPEQTILEFLKYTQKCDVLDIVDIERQKSIFLTEEFSLDDKEDLEVIDKKLAFLKELIKIENFFDLKFQIGLEISSADLMNIDILKSIINKEPIKNTFEENSIMLSDKKSALGFYNKTFDTKGILITIEEKEEKEIHLFGTSIKSIYMKWTLNNVKFADSEKLKNKLDYMEDGDVVNVKFIPGTKNEISYEYSWREAEKREIT
ncbi:hypothetical protein R0K17_02810 [Planococcus sp. SIMBA_143]